MAEETTEVTEEKGKEVLPEGAIGKLESDPSYPEMMTAKASLEIIRTSDGLIYIDRGKAIEYEEALRERRKAPGT